MLPEVKESTKKNPKVKTEEPGKRMTLKGTKRQKNRRE
jgi:hypothetical protein